jgi:hypothetical protein
MQMLFHAVLYSRGIEYRLRGPHGIDRIMFNHVLDTSMKDMYQWTTSFELNPNTTDIIVPATIHRNGNG